MIKGINEYTDAYVIEQTIELVKEIKEGFSDKVAIEKRAIKKLNKSRVDPKYRYLAFTDNLLTADYNYKGLKSLHEKREQLYTGYVSHFDIIIKKLYKLLSIKQALNNQIDEITNMSYDDEMKRLDAEVTELESIIDETEECK